MFHGRNPHPTAQKCQNSVGNPRSDTSPPALECTAHLNPVQADYAPFCLILPFCPHARAHHPTLPGIETVLEQRLEC